MSKNQFMEVVEIQDLLGFANGNCPRSKPSCCLIWVIKYALANQLIMFCGCPYTSVLQLGRSKAEAIESERTTGANS